LSLLPEPLGIFSNRIAKIAPRFWLAIWRAANEQFDFSDDFKSPGYSKATARAAAAVMPKTLAKSLCKALVTVCRHNGAKPLRMKNGCGLGCDAGAWFLLEDVARLNKRHFDGYEWMLNKSLEAAIMEIVQVVVYDTQHGRGRFQIGIDIYQEGGGFSGNPLTCYPLEHTPGLGAMGSGNVATALMVGSVPLVQGDMVRPFCIRATTGHPKCSYLDFARMSKKLEPVHILDLNGVFHMSNRCKILSIFKSGPLAGGLHGTRAHVYLLTFLSSDQHNQVTGRGDRPDKNPDEHTTV
jgi:hypothetical protein